MLYAVKHGGTIYTARTRDTLGYGLEILFGQPMLMGQPDPAGWYGRMEMVSTAALDAQTDYPVQDVRHAVENEPADESQF